MVKNVFLALKKKWWKLSQLATGAYLPNGRRRRQVIRICACVLEQAGIVTIPPTLPGKVHLVPAVGSFAKCLNYCPRFHRWHFDCGDPSLTHIEKAKERGDDALILAQGAHLEDWLLRGLWKHGLFLCDWNRWWHWKEAGVFEILSKGFVLAVLNVAQTAYGPL